jgi:hypothetical protein
MDKPAAKAVNAAAIDRVISISVAPKSAPGAKSAVHDALPAFDDALPAFGTDSW